MWRIKTKKEMEMKVNKEQTDHKLKAVTDSGVLFWWPHEGRNNHIQDNVRPPKLFKKNKSPHTKTVLYWFISYCIFLQIFFSRW
jgi:hypothetical protein